MRGSLARWLLGLSVWLLAPAVFAAEPRFELTLLDTPTSDPSIATVVEGKLDSHFQPFKYSDVRVRTGVFWLKMRSLDAFHPAGLPVVIFRKSRMTELEIFAVRGGRATPLSRAVEFPEFGGLQDAVFVVPEGLSSGESLYARLYEPHSHSRNELGFSAGTLQAILARSAEHGRMIALAFGALLAMAFTALLMWLVLSDRLLILYATLFAFQSLYIAYLSGQGFEWPLLSYARGLTSFSPPVLTFAWNVPVSLTGAIACLFIRDIAELRHFSPKVYAAFGWFAVAFVLSAISNLAKLVGFGVQVTVAGNLLFIASGIFALSVAFLAWRRGNRAAGSFLVAWGLLESFTIGTAVYMIFATTDEAEHLLYYGLPLSMVAAAVLIALGLADRIRDQRHALSDAERRAQTDPLTGVLNRRSLIERLESACLRSQSRGLPIALLFIDLDHFKQINDTYGHVAGDACLAAIISPIQAELRQSDVIGRYGGEEFIVILSSADLAAAHPIAERICRRVSDVRVEGFGKPIRLTCSIGVASSDTLGVWGEHLIAQADAAVYAAKRMGRNCVHAARMAA